MSIALYSFRINRYFFFFFTTTKDSYSVCRRCAVHRHTDLFRQPQAVNGKKLIKERVFAREVSFVLRR